MVTQWLKRARAGWLVACLALALAAGSITLVGGSADRAAGQTARESEQASGEVVGRVTGAGGRPLAGVRVIVRTAPFHPWSSGPGKPQMPPGPTWEGRTDTKGRYRINQVDAGPHRVEFRRPGYAKVFNGRALTVDTAADLQIRADAVIRANAVLRRAGQVRGKVRHVGGRAVANVVVEASPAGSRAWSRVSSAVTGSRGAYVLKGLPPGRHLVRTVVAKSGTVFHPSATRVEGARAVRVRAGKRRSDVNIAVPAPAVVTGRVLSPQGTPVPDALVQVHEGIQDMGRYGSMMIGYEQVRTDVDGRYRFRKPTAELTIWVGSASDPRACEGVSTWVDGVRVDAGRTLVKDLRIPAPAAVTGTVTDTEGRPVGHAVVTARLEGPDCQTEARTDAAGRYSFTGMTPGKYRIRFASDSLTASTYLPTEYGGTAVPGSGTLLTLSPGRSLSGIDAVLTLGGQIAGRVTLPAGVRTSWINVTATQVVADDLASVEQSGVVSADGRFEIVGLRTGTYRVSFNLGFEGAMGLDEVERVFYVEGGSSRDVGEGTLLEVVEGEVLGSREAVLDVGGSISGTVVDGDGRPREGVEVLAQRRGTTFSGAPGWVRAGSSWTDAQGRYTVRGLSAGSYRIGFGGSEGEFYPDVADVEDARDLVVERNAAVRGIDAELVFDWD